MAGGNAINRPRPSLRRNLTRLGRVKKAQKKKEKGRGTKRAVVDELTPIAIHKKRRTNPLANITLSGKKKRLLLKEIKRNQKEMCAMEVVPKQKDKTEQEKANEKKQSKGMDTS